MLAHAAAPRRELDKPLEQGIDFRVQERLLDWFAACKRHETAARLGLDAVPSHANFLLVRTGDGAGVTDALLHKGVIVRPMNAYGFPDHVRITFGTAEEDARTIAALEAVLAERGRDAAGAA